MEPIPQRATIVLEHASATMDFDDEDYNDGQSWSVVAYLVFDSGSGRDRAGHTLDDRFVIRKSTLAPLIANVRLGSILAVRFALQALCWKTACGYEPST